MSGTSNEAAPGCAHVRVTESQCQDCGSCIHDVVLNGACFYCGSEDLDPIAMSPKSRAVVIPATALVRKR